MVVEKFPSVESATEDGLVAFGGDLEIPTLLLAYKSGIFPWPINKEYPLAWFSPNKRGVIKCGELQISRTNKKILKQDRFTVKFNSNFVEVIDNCQSIKRVDEPDTWITDDLKKAYIDLFNAGLAFSVESYLDKKLVGGIYGVVIGNLVSAESMFHKSSNASKIALIRLIQYLNSKDIKYLDTQMITPVVKSLGGVEINRAIFLEYAKQSSIKQTGKKLFF